MEELFAGGGIQGELPLRLHRPDVADADADEPDALALAPVGVEEAEGVGEDRVAVRGRGGAADGASERREVGAAEFERHGAPDEAAVSAALGTGGLPDPDLLVRTGGERRLSNFLLWQVAYTELYFTDCLWPDFDAGEFDAALDWYARRERRFGGDAAEAA